MKLIICLLFTFCAFHHDNKSVVVKQISSVNPEHCSKYTLKDSTAKKPILDITFKVSLYSYQGLDPNILEVPFRLSGNLMLVEAELNDKKGFFIFDSGAPELIVNAKYLPNHRFNEEREATGVTGDIAQVRLQTIEQFKWQEYSLQKTRIKAIDMSHIERVRNEEILGLIGFELFKDFEVLLDFKISKIFLYKLDRSGEKLSLREDDKTPDHQASFTLADHVPILRLTLGENTLDFGLDTGAEMNILDIRSKSKVLSYFTIKKRGLLYGNGQDQIEILMGEISGLELEKVKFPNLKAMLADLRHLNKAYGVKLDGVLGYHFLIQFKLALNFVKKEIYLWKPALVSTQK
ncbi:MAG: hypothetical protein NW226_07055 [Microscillaceae bacterium]|nr:hypothetical protein [Microscillaceae bacterium]